MNVTIKIDRNYPTPAYLQLKNKLSEAIADRSLAPGEALPSERDLAEILKLSRMTVRRAFEELVADNLVERRQGSGTYVLPSRVEQHFDKVLSFTEEAKTLGFDAGSRVLDASTVAADQRVADALGISKGDQVFKITRLRSADGAPLALQVSWLSPRFSDFPVDKLRTAGSLYQVLASRYKVKPHHAHQTISARMPMRFECVNLDIERNVPLLALERFTYDADDQPIEYVRSAYRSDKYQVGLELQS
ncbi:MAG: GntR family transcriptional regulator [Trueperaceae bacterium]|nr:GntR family transcriptional regulator [Trueperaceae bacterium]